MEALSSINNYQMTYPTIEDNQYSFIQHINDMCVVLDGNFHIMMINERYSILTKYKKENIVGRHVSALFPKNQESFFSKVLEELYFQEKIYNKDTYFRVSGKKNLPVSLSISPIENDLGGKGYLIIARDRVRDLIQRNKLKAKNKDLETFVYRVSHDLKGPLASVKGLLELVEKEEEDLQTYKHYIQLIKNSTNKLESTLSGLLEIGLSANKKTQNTKFNIRECVEDVIKSFEGYPGNKEVIIHITANSQLEIDTEERTFRSILQNLIENSIKYRKQHVNDSVTKISARKYKDGIKIKVKDNGLGMDKDVLDKAFEMFFRGGHEGEGSGLGLFIVKSNVERLGGYLKVNSEVDLGTEMTIYIPNK